MFRDKRSRYDYPSTTLRVLEEDPSKTTKSCQMTVVIDEPNDGVSHGKRGVDGHMIKI